MFRFGKKMPNKFIYSAKHQKHIWEGSGSGRIQFFLGHPDPDPDFKNRIQGFSNLDLKKMDRIRNTD